MREIYTLINAMINRFSTYIYMLVFYRTGTSILVLVCYYTKTSFLLQCGRDDESRLSGAELGADAEDELWLFIQLPLLFRGCSEGSIFGIGLGALPGGGGNILPICDGSNVTKT